MKRTNESGFTMIEVMIAILLTAIALIGVIALYMTETRASSFSRHSTEAAVLAADKLEELRTLAQPVLPVVGNDGAVKMDALGQTGTAGAIYERAWSVTAIATTTEYVEVQVRVGWNEDEVAATCSPAGGVVAAGVCASKFCMPSGVCASRAVTVFGRRNP